MGYTAAPFANVFVDPGDAEDAFPRDFLISLPRPAGYMGVQDFHDLEPTERTYASSQEMAHVRGIISEHDDRLQAAMDSFLLAGALKLFRIDHGVAEAPFRHHTMLVHESVRQDEHAELALRINSMWHEAGYASLEGHARLASLWETDFALVSAARAADLPNPASYDELRPFVSRARQLIGSGGNPVVVVNGDSDRYFEQLDLDFDRTPHVWKILVGGTKLSRGFTIEGLTVSYYRRMTRQSDTLMQMGRWFGFRPGYRDLVRLYIGRDEALTKNSSADLYEAFESVCREEELFRQQLAQYSLPVDGRPQIAPAQIPPLVAQHLPWLKPTARNKMFNAEIVELRSPGQPVEPTAYPRAADSLRRNSERWQPLLGALPAEPIMLTAPSADNTGAGRSFPALSARISHSSLLSVLTALEWEFKDVFQPHLRYLAQLDGRLATVENWLLIAPQLTGQKQVRASVLGSVPLSLVRRTRPADRPFNRIAGVEHRLAGQALIDTASTAHDSRVGPRTGVALLYPVVEGRSAVDVQAVVSRGQADPGKVIMAFTLIPPRSAAGAQHRLIHFRARDSRDDGETEVPLDEN